MKNWRVIPDAGPPFIDKVNDAEASARRLAEFDAVCVNPGRQEDPKPPLLPAWCAWTKEANKSIMVNNAKIPKKRAP